MPGLMEVLQGKHSLPIPLLWGVFMPGLVEVLKGKHSLYPFLYCGESSCQVWWRFCRVSIAYTHPFTVGSLHARFGGGSAG